MKYVIVMRETNYRDDDYGKKLPVMICHTYEQAEEWLLEHGYSEHEREKGRYSKTQYHSNTEAIIHAAHEVIRTAHEEEVSPT